MSDLLRVKRIELHGAALLGLLQGRARMSAQSESIPADARVLFIDDQGVHNPYVPRDVHGVVWLLVESAEFAPLAECCSPCLS
jgi:hypothetical protein